MKNPSSIKAVIIDDDSYTREQLGDLLRRNFPIIDLTDSCSSATEGLEVIQRVQPGVVFLDIEMPDMSGFQLLERIPVINFEIIFITSFNEYAIKAIRFSALDYLLKPIRMDELQKAVERLTAKTASDTDAQARVGNFILNMQTRKTAEFRLAISTTEGTIFLPADEIIRLEADINYTHFILRDGKKIMASRTLKEFSGLLADHDFIRTHKSHLVNRRYVRQLSSDRHLIMSDNSKVEVSTRKWEDVKTMLRTN